MGLNVLTKNVPMGDIGASHPPTFSNLQEGWSKVSKAARRLAIVFSVTFVVCSNNVVTIVGQLVRTPSSQAGGSADHWF